MGQLTILGNRWLTEETESCLSLVVFGIQGHLYRHYCNFALNSD